MSEPDDLPTKEDFIVNGITAVIENNNDECEICQIDKLGAEHPAVRITACGHIFATVCLLKHFDSNLTLSNCCPKCRVVLWYKGGSEYYNEEYDAEIDSDAESEYGDVLHMPEPSTHFTYTDPTDAGESWIEQVDRTSAVVDEFLHALWIELWMVQEWAEYSAADLGVFVDRALREVELRMQQSNRPKMMDVCYDLVERLLRGREWEELAEEDLEWAKNKMEVFLWQSQ